MPEPYGVRPRLMKGATRPSGEACSQRGCLRDYTPIVAEGNRHVPLWRQLLEYFQLPGGALPLPDPPPGCVTVGHPQDESLPMRLRSRYMIVDLSDHPMYFEFPGLSPEGQAGFVITVEAMIRVVDPMAVVDRRVRSMRFHVFPAVSAQVIHALGSVPSGGKVTVTSLNVTRRLIAQEVRRRLVPGATLQMDFFQVMPVNVTVGYDVGTAAHLDNLLTAERNADLHNRLVDLHYGDAELRHSWTVNLVQSFADTGEHALPGGRRVGESRYSFEGLQPRRSGASERPGSPPGPPDDGADGGGPAGPEGEPVLVDREHLPVQEPTAAEEPGTDDVLPEP